MTFPLVGDQLRLRPSRLKDAALFAECYEDWPADKLGVFTVDRANRECTLCAFGNRKVAAPLTDKSNWMQTLVVEVNTPIKGLDMPVGAAIGLHRATAKGKVVTVLNQIFIPAAVGLGLFAELQTILQTYLFTVLEGDKAQFELFPEAVSAIAHVDNRETFTELVGVLSESGKPVLAGEITREAWLAGSKI